MAKDIVVIAELKEGQLAPVTREVLAGALSLAAASGGAVSALILGQGLAEPAKAAIAAGASTVYTADDAALAAYQPDAYLQVVQQAIKTANASIVLMPHGDVAKDLAPKLAFRLQAGLTTDCTALTLSPDGNLVATKPVYGGNALAVFEATTELQMATVRAKSFEPVPDEPRRQGNIVPLNVAIDASALKVRVIEVRKEKAVDLRLEDAQVVVAGGRGLGEAANFKRVEELAQALGGAPGATRAICDDGWVDRGLQIGLTGRTVTPNLYIAIGISGASQHMAGCAGASNIVAVNKDKDANIFKEARYGVVGDWAEVLPAFIEMCKELRGA